MTKKYLVSTSKKSFMNKPTDFCFSKCYLRRPFLQPISGPYAPASIAVHPVHSPGECPLWRISLNLVSWTKEEPWTMNRKHFVSKHPKLTETACASEIGLESSLPSLDSYGFLFLKHYFAWDHPDSDQFGPPFWVEICKRVHQCGACIVSMGKRHSPDNHSIATCFSMIRTKALQISLFSPNFEAQTEKANLQL